MDGKQQLAAFPREYTDAIKQAQNSTTAALQAGLRLLEIEFPTSSLASVSGDGEGANEMSFSLGFLRQYLRIFQDRAAATRIFFPDDKELQVARHGKAMDPNAGSRQLDPVFEQTAFQLDYLTRPNAFSDMGLDFGKVAVVERAQPSDERFVCAYPHFNVNEMLAVEELWEGAARDTDRPIVIFNGELDRIRSGYYPSLFYPKIGKLAKNLLPHMETIYYIHNFKGSGGGVLFRAYPGPWQVLRGTPLDPGSLQVIHTQDTMPTLKQVALEILPRRRT
ncbi:hypothetical protein WJX81_002326 [Elliptochloris bilobata]|uniref:DUF1995 domain-containing protein n=1 Tax=Elliptochloris bilobata TaxID=381761 RepID=A0AAW1S670_9CHLO